MSKYNQKIKQYQVISDYLKQENENQANQFVTFDKEKLCSICHTGSFSEPFYYFNCTHLFHQKCLADKIIEFCPSKAVDIQRYRQVIADFKKKYLMKKKSRLTRRSRQRGDHERVQDLR